MIPTEQPALEGITSINILWMMMMYTVPLLLRSETLPGEWLVRF